MRTELVWTIENVFKQGSKKQLKILFFVSESIQRNHKHGQYHACNGKSGRSVE